MRLKTRNKAFNTKIHVHDSPTSVPAKRIPEKHAYTTSRRPVGRIPLSWNSNRPNKLLDDLVNGQSLQFYVRG